MTKMSNKREIATSDPRIILKWLDELENEDQETVGERLSEESDGDHEVAEENQESAILTIDENHVVEPFYHENDFNYEVIEVITSPETPVVDTVDKNHEPINHENEKTDQEFIVVDISGNYDLSGVNENDSNHSDDNSEYNPENDSSDDDCSNSENDSSHSENDCNAANSSGGLSLASSRNVQGSASSVAISTNENEQGDRENPECIKKKRARTGKADKTTWFRNINQKNRELGLEYTGKSKKNKSQKVPRNIKPPCNCKMSQNTKSQLKCGEFNEDDRQLIFDHFWKETWDEKKMYVGCLVDVELPVDTRHRKTKEKSRRKHTLKFHLKKNGVRIRVCKKMFLATLAINEWSAINWAETSKTRKSLPPEQKIKKSRSDDLKRLSVVSFLDALPKVPSHYCRSNTSRLYLEPIFYSYKALYREYVKNSKEKQEKVAGRTMFNDILKDMKISIFSPKKDKCDVCEAHKLGLAHITEEQFQEHQSKKEEARAEKIRDKENGKFVYTMDVQAVLVCPKTRSSSMYYKTKLAVHNFTVYNMKNAAVHCYMWDESEADLSADVFSSILAHFVASEIPFKSGDEVIFFSDGCAYQNRNSTLSNMFVHLAIKYSITIIQKYLEKGHTQMECDSIHSAIENQLRKQEIYLPSGYVSACRAARPDHVYNVEYLDHSFFQKCVYKYYPTIRPSNKVGDPTVADLRALKYTPDGGLYFKFRHNEDWKNIDDTQRKRRSPNTSRSSTEKEIIAPRLFAERRKIKKGKYVDLQELKKVLPSDTHSFYDMLPFSDV